MVQNYFQILSQNLKQCFQNKKKIMVVRVFVRIYTKLWQILIEFYIEFYNLYGCIFHWLRTTLLIIKEEIMVLFIPSVCAKIVTLKIFPPAKISIYCERFFLEIIFFISAMIIYVVIFQIYNVFKRFRAT